MLDSLSPAAGPSFQPSYEIFPHALDGLAQKHGSQRTNPDDERAPETFVVATRLKSLVQSEMDSCPPQDAL